MLLMERVRARALEFDVLHFHMDYWPNSLFSRQPVPFLTTLHGRLDLPELKPVYAGLPAAPLVAISNSQRAALPEGNFIGTVYHGMPENLLTPRPVRPSYLAFLGRICPEKRADRAIRIARRVGMPLKLAAKVDRVDQEYFLTKIKPMLGLDAELIGEINDDRKSGFLSEAYALLMPIDWPEPFGLVMIEAMACGTPVIAYNHGSVAEVLEDGVTGFIVNSEDEAVAALDKVSGLSRERIRERFKARFTARRMAEDYLEIYEHLKTRRLRALRLAG
jgi:glycosyltransferase involved in cell wall biosynthesis